VHKYRPLTCGFSVWSTRARWLVCALPLDADLVKGYARAWPGILGLVLIDGYDGYDDYPVMPGEALLEMPGFWAAYFGWIEESEFGVSEAEFDEAFAALYDESEWPVFRIPFSDGHVAVVVHRNFPEDSGIEYFIQHPGWGRIGYLASLEGHWAGPGLAWRELVHIARNPGPEDAEGIRDPHQRLLLLLPALGDAERPDDAADLVIEALVSIGLPAERASRAANLLLINPMWGDDVGHWAFPERRPDDGDGVFAGILECDYHHSPRCGKQLALGITREQSDRLARALGTWPE
jgi:hypothetical protein